MRMCRAGTLILAGAAWYGASTAAETDLYGDPLPAGAVCAWAVPRPARPGWNGQGPAFFRRRQVAPGGLRRLHARALGDEHRPLARRGTSRPCLSFRRCLLSRRVAQVALSASQRIGGEQPGFEIVRRLVDTSFGKELRRLPPSNQDQDLAMAFSPDRTLLFSIGSDGVLRIEETASGTELLQQKIPRRR